MYVCICQGVTERQIEEAVSNGAASLSDLQEQLQVARCCGSCSETVESLLARLEPTSGACLEPA